MQEVLLIGLVLLATVAVALAVALFARARLESYETGRPRFANVALWVLVATTIVLVWDLIVLRLLPASVGSDIRVGLSFFAPFVVVPVCFWQAFRDRPGQTANRYPWFGASIVSASFLSAATFGASLALWALVKSLGAE